MEGGSNVEVEVKVKIEDEVEEVRGSGYSGARPPKSVKCRGTEQVNYR